jgi:hypothetical protein
MWIYNRKILGEFFAKGEWLVLSLHKLMRHFRRLPYFVCETYNENLAQGLLQLYRENKMFSLIPFELAQPPIPTQEDTTNVATKITLPV